MRGATRLSMGLIPLILGATLSPAAGPSAPATRTFASANGLYFAVVERGADDKPSTVSVSEGTPGQGGALRWKAEVGCEVAPLDVLVSDDGHHVVTFDNWLRPGYGDHVVAVYLDGRQVVRWSLEQVLLPGELKALPTSTAQRPWRRHAIEMLVDFNGRRYLGVWLGLLGRWKVWDLTAARPLVVPSPLLLGRFDGLARAWSLRQFEARGGNRIAAIRFLGALRDGRDRGVLERQLAAEDDYHWATYFFGDEFHRCGGHSDTRRAADSALAALDGRRPAEVRPSAYTRRKARGNPAMAQSVRPVKQKMVADGREANVDEKVLRRGIDQLLSEQEKFLARFLEQRDEERYVYLGVVDVTVRLSERPAGPGALWVYLVPESVETADWAEPRPVHRLRMDFGGAPSSPPRWPSAVPVRFEGVTPGRYWVKAVHDRAEPFFKGTGAACTPAEGDHESTRRDVVEVRPGEVCVGKATDCTTPFLAGRVPRAGTAADVTRP